MNHADSQGAIKLWILRDNEYEEARRLIRPERDMNPAGLRCRAAHFSVRAKRGRNMGRRSKAAYLSLTRRSLLSTVSLNCTCNSATTPSAGA